MLISLLLRLYNWLSQLLIHWAMLLVPSECSKPFPISCSTIGLKASFPQFSSFSPFLQLSSLRQASPVLSEPFELVSSQFFSASVEDVQRQGQKKKQDMFWLRISWLWQPWLCGLTPFKFSLASQTLAPLWYLDGRGHQIVRGQSFMIMCHYVCYITSRMRMASF